MHLFCTLFLPLLAAAPSPEMASWPAHLGYSRGTLLLVENQHGWIMKLQDPQCEDLAAEIHLEMVGVKDGALARFGIEGPGAYLLNEGGRVVGSWKAKVPTDIRSAFAEVGWRSRLDELRAALRDNPDRLDLQWRLVEFLWLRARDRPVASNLTELALSLDQLLRLPGWMGGAPRPLPAFGPVDEARDRGALGELAHDHLEDVREALRRDPESLVAWEMMAFLCRWAPGDEPRIAPFLATLVPPPDRFRDVLAWPGQGALVLAEAQLRRLQDWSGLEAFAQSRVDFVLRQAGLLVPEPPALWVARLKPAPPERSPNMAFGEDSAKALGKWLTLLLEAQLLQDRGGTAANTLSLLIREGDGASIAQARGLLKRLKADSLLRSLDAAQ